jgi:RNase P protein component
MSQRAEYKFWYCVKLARESSRDSWQHAENAHQRREFRRISREAMQDARYWKKEMSA